MHENKLLLNEAKTEFLLIGTKQQLTKVNISHIKVSSANIAPHPPVKSLGVWFDSNLSMVDHINRTSSAAFYHLYNIRRIRKYLTKECTETLMFLEFWNCSIFYFILAYFLEDISSTATL